MCLAIPAKIIKIHKEDKVTVEIGGLEKDIFTSLLEEVKIGDYVIVHAGFAISKIDEEEAEKTLELYEEFFASI